MELTEKLITELQNRLKVGTRRGVHLNAIPGRSRYKIDLTRLGHIDSALPSKFIDALLSKNPLKFKVSWKDNVPDLNALFEEEQTQLVKITKSFNNLINQTETISSEKGINTFGFGFPILVRRDQTDNKLTVAPLVIWSLRIKRSKEFNTWIIERDSDDAIYFNEVLINHLFNDSKVEVGQIPPNFLEEDILSKDNLLRICESVIDSVNTTVPEDLNQIFREKINEIKPISDKKHYEKLPLTPFNAFIEFGGLFSIFEVQKQNIISDYEGVLDLENASIDLEDMDEHEFQPISSVDTDPSQQGILTSMERTRNILIQGPPGTGKSQTLTAILINALENGKKTIVVCEKRTALEVLQEALNGKGLFYQNILVRDIVRDRRAVVDSVRDRVDNSSYRRYRYEHSKEELDAIIERSKDLIASINKRHSKLDEKLVGNKNWTRIVGELLSEIKDNDESYDLEINQDLSFESDELNSLVELVRKAQRLYQKFEPNKSLSIINHSKLLGNNPYSIEDRLNEDVLHYEKSYNVIKELIDKYKIEYSQFRHKELQEQKDRIDRIFEDIETVLRRNSSNLDFFDEKRTNGLGYKFSAIFSKEKKSTLNDQKSLNQYFKNLQSATSDSKDYPQFTSIDVLKNTVSEFEQYKLQVRARLELFDNKVDLEFNHMNLIDSSLQNDTQNELKGHLTELKERIDSDAWFSNKVSIKNESELTESVGGLLTQKRDYFNHDDDPFTGEFNWFNFYNRLSPLEKEIIDALKEKQDWNKVFMSFYLNALLVSSATTDLPTNENDLIDLEESLSGLEEEQLKYIKEYWFSKQIDAARDFDLAHENLAVENLYNKRSSHKHKRLSLRKIVEFDLDLFTTFFPIILTTPDVCSNLFRGNNKYFDIVMFDEASQLKLEDNLPALLKGKQVIIAGDEHQMPPSNYFSKIFDGSQDEDEDDFEDEGQQIFESGLLSAESLLEFAEELSFEKKYLDFHYRSKHPYLIDFSNFAFYNQRLKPMPNTFEYSPIKFIQVNGTYVNHTNPTEVEAVLSILENNINRLPNGEYPTVGIATFNIHQRDLILNRINERRKLDKYHDFNEKILELEEGGLFVKNLENIQGDERDVIILTTTYGKTPEGKFAQRFGSINHQKGYKLLNVIVTRAKYKVYVCSSIPEDVYLNYKEHLIVEGSNNRRAVFFAYLAYARAVSENDREKRDAILLDLANNTTKSSSIDILNSDLESPFEEEVYHVLSEHFEEKNLIPQFQFAGFRIDIVYDSQKPGIPKIAVECDGAAYHSSREAYLYDKHRQSILEENGFVFHRIWSTNWWRNPKREAKRLVEFIRSIEQSDPKEFKDYSEIGLAFTHEDHSINEERKTPVSKKGEIEKTKTLVESTSPPKRHEKEQRIIEIGDEVTVKFINNGETLTIKIINKEKVGTDKMGKLKPISYKAPLAVAIKGKAVGEIVKVGGMDNFVEVLEIK